MNYKQVIVVRKDLNMSPGKLAAQVSHASMAFLTRAIQSAAVRSDSEHVSATLTFNYDFFRNWLAGSFTKVVLEAKNKNQLYKCIETALDFGMVENRDFFVICDSCRTELEPEEDGSTVTCVGFIPFPSDMIDVITGKYQLYR